MKIDYDKLLKKAKAKFEAEKQLFTKAMEPHRLSKTEFTGRNGA